MITTPPSGDPANETVWAFDLGKGSIGEAVRQGLHSSLQNKTAKHEVWRLCLRNAFNQVYPHGG